MTSIHETYADLFDDESSERRQRVIAALDHIYTRARPSTRSDEAVLAAMRRLPVIPYRQGHRRRFRRSLGALIPASLLLFGLGFVMSLRASPPASVSAEAIIQRAAAVQTSPNSALHVVYRESYGGKYTIWAEYGAHGKLTQLASTGIESTGGITTHIDRCVGGRRVMRCYDYEPASKILHREVTITAVEVAKAAGPLRYIDDLTGAGVARLLTRLMHHSPADVHLLPERRLNGALVYPIRVDGHPPSRQPTVIYYFDAHAYFMRGMVLLPPRGPGFADMVTEYTTLVKRETMPIAAVPPGTFKLRPPSGNQVWVVIP